MRKTNSSCGSSESIANFLLEGSPAPKCVRDRPRPKSRPKQPPNSPSGSQTKCIPPPLPIDKIMLARDRLLNESKFTNVRSSCESHSGSSPADLSIDLSSVNGSEHETEDDSEYSPKSSIQDEPKSEKPRKNSSKDLIHLYIDTLNDRNQLSKYLRVCDQCKEPSCVCEQIQSVQNSGRSSRCSEFSNFLLERMQNSPNKATDSGASTLHLSGESKSPNLALSIMQLKTAAQCARILADSLDSMLDVVREEIVKGNEPVFLTNFNDNQMEPLTTAFDTILNLQTQFNERTDSNE